MLTEAKKDSLVYLKGQTDTDNHVLSTFNSHLSLSLLTVSSWIIVNLKAEPIISSDILCYSHLSVSVHKVPSYLDVAATLGLK